MTQGVGRRGKWTLAEGVKGQGTPESALVHMRWPERHILVQPEGVAQALHLL